MIIGTSIHLLPNDLLFDLIAEIPNSSNDLLSFKQIPAWILGIIYCGELSNVDEVHIGYVMNDDAISYLSEIKKVYNSFQNMQQMQNQGSPMPWRPNNGAQYNQYGGFNGYGSQFGQQFGGA